MRTMISFSHRISPRGPRSSLVRGFPGALYSCREGRCSTAAQSTLIYYCFIFLFFYPFVYLYFMCQTCPFLGMLKLLLNGNAEKVTEYRVSMTNFRKGLISGEEFVHSCLQLFSDGCEFTKVSKFPARWRASALNFHSL